MFYTLPEDRQQTDTFHQSTVSPGKDNRPHTYLYPPPTKLQVDLVAALHARVHTHTQAHICTPTHGCTESPQITKRSENKLSVQCKAQA